MSRRRSPISTATSRARLLEMQAAVNYSNEEKRVEAVQRSLSPADLKALKELPGSSAALDAIGADLDGVDRKVFALLRDADVHPENIAAANALRLQQNVDTAREKRGEAGGDETFETIRDAALGAGNDPLSGADPLGLDDEKVRKDRNADAWKATQEAFGKLQPLPDGEKPKIEGPGAALYSYAVRARDYPVTKGYGKGARAEIVHEGVSRSSGQQRGQRRLVDVPERRMLTRDDVVHLVAMEAVSA